jgi:GNAT superfamily N-acetyltransferase
LPARRRARGNDNDIDHGDTDDGDTDDGDTAARAGHAPPLADGVVRTSVDAAGRAGDDPIPVSELPPPASDTGLQGRVIVRDGLAVAGAWSLVENGDCGIYAVETTPRWRRRGLARTLMQSVLGDAYWHGARTATLQSTPMGEPLYISLGFEPVGRYEEWVPA